MAKRKYLLPGEIISYDNNLYIAKESIRLDSACYKCSFHGAFGEKVCTLDYAKLSSLWKKYRRCPCAIFGYLVLIPGGKNA